MQFKRIWLKVAFFLPLLFIAQTSYAQKTQPIALKTNLLSDATKTINIGLEVPLSQKWTLDISAGVNPFEGDKQAKHWRVQPEARWWFCEQFNGHFVGSHLIGGQYSLKGIDISWLGGNDELKTGRRYEGWATGAGVVYGYQWILSRRLSLEAALGLGYIYSQYDKYGRCGAALESDDAHYFGVTKMAFNVIYFF